MEPSPPSFAPASGPRDRVASVTVAYEPDRERMQRQLEALAPQVDDVVIVDNSERNPVADWLDPACPALVRRFEANVGVAAGFNAGIAEARRRGARYVLLLDHDSVPGEGMVERLLAAVRSGGGRVAAAGPRVRDARDSSELPFVRIGWLRNPRQRCGEGVQVSCDFLISSGALIDLEAFDAVGAFDERLFIDSVDLEWSLRARSKGFQLIGCCDATLDHRLGDHRVRVARVIDLVVHSPERLYYMTRNRVLLYRRGYMPWGWKWKDSLRAAVKCGALALLVRPRRQYAAMALHGMLDALANRGGKRGSS